MIKRYNGSYDGVLEQEGEIRYLLQDNTKDYSRCEERDRKRKDLLKKKK